MAGSFKTILDMAVEKKGGADALEALLTKAKTPKELSIIPNDRWLSQMTKRVFQAGFAWSVIENKWGGFELAFEGFGPHRVSMYNDEDVGRLMADKTIVRNGQKVKSTIENATFLAALADEHGSAAKAFAEWPDDDYVGLLEMMKKRGSRLGGNTGQYVLRGLGKPAFIFSKDVVAGLVREGVVDKAPSGKRAMTHVQAAFISWRDETGRDFSQLSRILAVSV